MSKMTTTKPTQLEDLQDAKSAWDRHQLKLWQANYKVGEAQGTEGFTQRNDRWEREGLGPYILADNRLKEFMHEQDDKDK